MGKACIVRHETFSRARLWILALGGTILVPACHSPQRDPVGLERLAISKDGHSFVGATSGKKFTPWGFNYDRDYKLRLLEEYWDAEWPTVAEDFREMKQLGANVVRIHLQLPKFMDAPAQPNEHALAQLRRVVKLAEQTGLYLDITGLACYRKPDVPRWFDALDEAGRWRAQAKFWEAIAACCQASPAIFCYDLINEPVVPGEPRKAGDWLVGQLAGFYYVQAITLDPAGRPRPEIARKWVAQLVAAIRKHDTRHLITVGLLPTTGAGFVPQQLSGELDFMCVHIYPKRGEFADSLRTLKEFDVGKPLVIEEIFPINCNVTELGEFIEQSRPTATGWISFYWGQTPEQLEASTNAGGVLLRDWLKFFQEVNPNKRQ